MDPNRNRNSTNSNNNNNNNGNSQNWAAAAAVGAAVGAAAGGLYWLFSSNDKEKPQSSQQSNQQAKNKEQPKNNTRGSQRQQQSSQSDNSTISSYFTDMLRIMDTPVTPNRPEVKVPQNPSITNINGLLADIYVRYIALKDEEFEKHYRVFYIIFNLLHNQMKSADAYYNRYSSTVQFAGSHYDRLRITKPDEFDMDIIIRLPVNLLEDPMNPTNSDVVFEAKAPGYLQLKMGDQFKNLPQRDGGGWLINRTAFKWLDERNYLLRSKFIDWFRSVVDLALNSFGMNANGRRFTYVEGVPYTLRLSSSGPAITLIIENLSVGFRLDVDLVPALKFPEVRWPISKTYRKVPARCKKDIFMVVPKPNKAGVNRLDPERSWRLALHLQERELMHDTNNLRQAIRLIKKLRDSQGMNKIASYYIKTLFYWEVVERDDPTFWSRSNPATLFTIMVKQFHKALMNGNIPYFWEKSNNLIGHIERSTLTGYANKLAELIQVLETPSQYKLVAKYLLPPRDFEEYNKKFLHI